MAFSFKMPAGVSKTPDAGDGADDSDMTANMDSDDPGESKEPEMGEDTAGKAALGKALSAAIDSKNGMAIYEVFERLSRACK
jgi:uncharacterized membrane protein YkoI